MQNRTAKKVLWSTPTGKGKPLRVSYARSEEKGPFVNFLGGSRRAHMGTNSTKIEDLKCNAKEFFEQIDIHLHGHTFDCSRSESKKYVNQQTGEGVSPLTSSDEIQILCIRRFDYELNIYEPDTNNVLLYRRVATFNISKVSRDVHAPIGQALIKSPTVGKISYSDRVIGKRGKDTLLVEGEYQQPAVILCTKKIQSDDDVKKEVSLVNDVCDANNTFVKVYGAESDRDYSYVATEYCGTTLREFIRSFHNPKNQNLKDYNKLKEIIWEIVTAIAWLHRKGISHGNLNLDSIFVDKYFRAKILVLSLSKDDATELQLYKQVTTVYFGLR